jgi:hypothetical protein
LSVSCQQWWSNHQAELRAYLADEEPVSANQNTLKPENPVVSECLAKPEVFIKFSVVDGGIRMESSLGESKEEDNIRFTNLIYQLTTEKQNSNILKHLQMTGISQDSINQIIDRWQTFKIVENQKKKIDETKNKVVVRASQVLPNANKE